jgi:hypothetical protein
MIHLQTFFSGILSYSFLDEMDTEICPLVITIKELLSVSELTIRYL